MAMGKRKPNEVREVIRQEEARGRGYVYSEEEKEAYQRRKKQWKDILRAMTWEEVTIALSLRQGKPEYDEYYRIWKDYHRDRDEAY